MATTTAVAKRGQDSALVITGGGAFSAEENAIISAKMTPEMEQFLHKTNKRYVELDLAELDLTKKIKQKERELRDTPAYKSLVEYRKQLKVLRTLRHELRVKFLGVMESILANVKRGLPLYKKLVMMLSEGE